jgi:5-methylcytosine-specific restriction endonuclease McrA
MLVKSTSGPYSPNTHALLHESHRSHPVIGFGLGTGEGFSPGDAWMDLCCQPYIKQLIPGIGHEVMSLSLVRGRAVTNPAARWRWTVKRMRRFVVDMAEARLVTQELAEAMLTVIRAPRSRRRDAIPPKTDVAILAKTSGKCVYCGVALTRRKGQPNSYHRDHVLAATKGGTEDIANLIPSCRTCNLRKGAKTFQEFTEGK